MLQKAIETRLLQRNHEKHDDDDENTNKPCLDYGCPMHPIEVDPVMSNNDNDNRRARAFLDASNRSHAFVAMMTRKSNRKNPPFNQDSAVALWPFRTAQTTHANDFLIGLFDGHGRQGHAMSQYAAREFPAILARRFNEHRNANDDNDWIRAALNASFVETDANAPPMHALLGGTTASVILRRGSKLYLANAGDSRTIVVVGAAARKDAEIVYSTRLDKPHLEEERRRIEGLGGKITIPAGHPAWSRVLVRSEAEGETIGLAMSRSLGDWEWGAVGVTPEPLIDVLDLRNLPEHAFVLAASDGMWDARPRPRFFANLFAEAYRQGQDPFRQCYHVIEKISPKNKTWYRDDITIVAAKLLTVGASETP